MSTDIITNRAGGAVGTSARLDVRAMMGHYLAPFKAAEPWRETLATIDRHQYATQRDCNGGLIALHDWNKPHEKGWAIEAALAVHNATRGLLSAVWDAADALDEAMAPPPEEVVRQLLGAMLSFFRAKPGEGAPIYIDGLVWLLMEPETGNPICAPAIAAATKEAWITSTFPPSGHEFLQLCKKHQGRIEQVHSQLNWISDASLSAREVLEKLAPEKLPKRNPRELSEEELNDIFGED